LSTIIQFVLVIKLTITKETRRLVSRGRDQRGRDRRGRDCKGRVLRDFSLFKPNRINMNVHSATCSCSVELYKMWYTLADFLPNWNFRVVFSTYRYCMTRQALAHILTINVPLFKKLRDIFFFWGQSLYEPLLGTF
jgi:hypothetical protein